MFVFTILGRVSEDLPECTQDLMIDVTKGYYQHFYPIAEVKELIKVEPGSS